jgi:hypothetical protein
MGVYIRPEYLDRRRQEGNYEAWRDSPIGNGGSYEDYQRWIGSMGPSGPTPQPGPVPTPIAPPPSIPSPSAGPPAYAPPQVQVPALLSNPQPQGLGGMPLIRDRMMASTLVPFAQANWGVPQVNPAYLTQPVRLPNGAIPADVMSTSMPTLGLGGPGAAQLVGFGGKKIPRMPMYGMGTV